MQLQGFSPLSISNLFHAYLNIIPLPASHTITLLILPDNPDVLTFCYFLSSVPFNRRNCAFSTVQCKMMHWLSKKHCPSKFDVVSLKFWMLLQTAMKVTSQTFLAPSGASVQVIQLLNGRVAAGFQMSSGYISFSALPVEWTAWNNTVRWVWCLKLDINIALTTYEGLFSRAGKEYWAAISTFLVFWERCTELDIGSFSKL